MDIKSPWDEVDEKMIKMFGSEERLNMFLAYASNPRCFEEPDMESILRAFSEPYIRRN